MSMRVELPVLETNRLILREIDFCDQNHMFEYAQLDSVGPIAGWAPHRTLQDTKTIIQMFRDKKKYGQLGVFAVILKQENKMIGTLELHSYVQGFKAELGYTISPFYWGQGYAVEGAKVVLQWAFETLHLKRIECAMLTKNLRSKRVCEKLELTYEGIRKKGYMLYDGTIHNLLVYALTDDEYFARKKEMENKDEYMQSKL